MKAKLATLATGALAAGLLGACGAVPPSEGLVPETSADAPEVEIVPEVAPEPEWTARERWESPFAVSGAGPTVVRGQRTVVVIDADSSIAAALAQREDMERGPAPSSTNRAATVFTADPDDDDRPVGGSPQRAPSTAERDDPEEVAITDEEERPASQGSSRTAVNGETVSRAPEGRENAEAREDGETTDEVEVASRAAGRTTVESDMGYHLVEEGETWSRVVIRYRLASEALAAANPDVDPTALRVGQILRIPVSPPVRRSHRVAPGETIRDIARRYNVTPDEIREANLLANDRLLAGWTLVIPRSSSEDDR